MSVLETAHASQIDRSATFSLSVTRMSFANICLRLVYLFLNTSASNPDLSKINTFHVFTYKDILKEHSKTHTFKYFVHFSRLPRVQLTAADTKKKKNTYLHYLYNVLILAMKTF